MKEERRYRIKAFGIAFLMAAVIIIPVVIYSGGYLVYYGDYNAQQITFYKECIRSVQQGEFGWNWDTNLGVNFIGSYSFYTLGSPFFWLAALFPVSVSQYLMAPLLALKMALSSLFAYIYLRRFTKSGDSALIGALLYAFSGYSIGNAVFFHFHEAICFFPLLLTALEEAVVNKRRGMFALCVALCALVNYFFFIGECVFLVIYFIARLISDSKFRISVGDFFCLAFESVAGVMAAGILFVPSIVQVMDIGRAGSLLNGIDLLVYKEPQTYLTILKALFLPAEQFSRQMMFVSNITGWRSVTMYLPLFSVAGVIAYMRSSVKRSWISTLIRTMAVFAFVPALNALFTMFNSEYYARWYYMASLILALATARALDEDSADWKAGCAVSFCGALFFGIVYFFLPYVISSHEGENYDVRESVKYHMPIELGWVELEGVVIVFVALASSVLLALLLRSRRRLPRAKYMENLLSALVITGIVLGCFHFFEGRLSGPVYKMYNNLLESRVEIDDDEFFRINSDDIMNYNLAWGYSSPQSFHSIVPASITDLHTAMASANHSVVVSRTSDDLAFDALTRVKYIVKSALFQQGEPAEYYDEMKLYKYIGRQDDVNIFRSEAVVPMACSYDTCCSVKDVSDKTGGEQETNLSANLMLHSVALDDATYEKYADILTREVPTREQLDNDRMMADIADRQSLGAESFEITKKGFAFRTNYASDRIVVISTAYDRGWSARINGEAAEVDRANVGFLAIRVPAGENEVVFTYTAPGLKLGIILTAVGLSAIAAYILVVWLVLKKRPKKTPLPAADRGVSLHSGYIARLTEKGLEN